jgi:hypothetical protein
MEVCLLCVLSGRGLCDELITRPEESYRLWCVVVYDQKNVVVEEAIARAGLQSQRNEQTDKEPTVRRCNTYGVYSVFFKSTCFGDQYAHHQEYNKVTTAFCTALYYCFSSEYCTVHVLVLYMLLYCTLFLYCTLSLYCTCSSIVLCLLVLHVILP